MNNKRENENEIRTDKQGVSWYRKKITDMVNWIDNEKYLRRIYIILNDYIKEKSE